MFWLVFAVLGAVLLSCLSLAVGAAVGASTTQEQFLNVVLPALSAMGGWVSGIGALGAVLATLWLADRQRREDVEDARVKPSALVIPDTMEHLLGVEVVSTGKRPILLSSVCFAVKGASNYLQPLGLHEFSERLPKRLVYGERLQLVFPVRLLVKLDELIQEEGGLSPVIEVVVASTIRDFKAPVPVSMITGLLRENRGA